MNPSQIKIKNIATYLRRIGQLAETGDIEAIKMQVKLGLKLCEDSTRRKSDD